MSKNDGNNPIKLRKAIRELLEWIAFHHQCESLPDIELFDRCVKLSNWRPDPEKFILLERDLELAKRRLEHSTSKLRKIRTT